MKKLLAFLLGIMVMATMIAGCGGGDKKDDKKPAAQKFINIATGGTSGTYFPLGGALADILNKNIPATMLTATITGIKRDVRFLLISLFAIIHWD